MARAEKFKIVSWKKKELEVFEDFLFPLDFF
jgi:hypothetical protein